MSGFGKLIITLSIVSFVFQLLIPIFQLKSKYLPLFIVLVAGEVLNKVFSAHLPYVNFMFILSYSLTLPALLQVYWKKWMFWLFLILFLLVALSIPALNNYYGFIVIIITSTAAAIYILFQLVRKGVEQFRISAFLVALFFYMIIPDLKLYFVLSGERINEMFFVIVTVIDLILTISLLFLREDNPRHNYSFVAAAEMTGKWTLHCYFISGCFLYR